MPHRSCSPSPFDDHRQSSPLHFLYPTMIHAASSKSQARADAAAQADISRILDPAYLPSSSSRAANSSSAAVTAYLDPYGDLHDPDYRHFPPAPIHSPSHNSKSRYATTRRTSRGTSPRPQFDWELDIDEHALEEEYADEDAVPLSSRHSPGNYRHQQLSGRSWSSTQSGRPRQRDSSFSTMSNITYTPAHYSPTGTASTLPTSYEDDFQLDADSPFEEPKEKKKHRRLSKGDKEKEKERMKKSDEKTKVLHEKEPRRSLERHHIVHTIAEYDDDESHFQQNESHSPSHSASSRATHNVELLPTHHDNEKQEYAPTCGQSLRRQWQSFALSFRFGIFRTRKRVMRRVASIL